MNLFDVGTGPVLQHDAVLDILSNSSAAFKSMG